ncbi:MAG: alkaline phosphatase family protein [Bacteroidia bacterium]|nr:alkaline phosphatase family protein [Bacteroidia bacterium]
MRFFLLFIPVLLSLSCRKDLAVTSPSAEHVIVVVMDGARYSETFGAPDLMYIPVMRSLLPEACIFPSFFQDGYTQTTCGHTAITTGVYQNINNGGQEIPDEPSFLQVWLRERKKDNSGAWIITSKDKLEVLRNCKNSAWKDLYMPRTDCGINGLATGYRHDTITLQRVLGTMAAQHPSLLVVNFREPDGSAHSGSWDGYLQGIRDVDSYVGRIWQFIQSDPVYRNKTALIVTNDHGRHSTNIADGFVSHGDGCDGCRHIMLFAIGQGIPDGKEVNNRYSLKDLHHTITSILGISDPEGDGELIPELLGVQ